MIRDRIVVGTKDKKLSAYLQMDADVTLEVTKRKVRQREAVAGQKDVVQTKQQSSTQKRQFIPRRLTGGNSIIRLHPQGPAHSQGLLRLGRSVCAAAERSIQDRIALLER